MLSELDLFCWGCLGAAAPEILRLYKWGARWGKSHRRFPPMRYLLVLPFFIALGGTVAILLEGNSRHAAFYMGLAMPLVISVAAHKPMRRLQRNTAGKTERGGIATIAEKAESPIGSLREYLHLLFI